MSGPRVYSAETRSRKLRARLAAAGVGLLVVRGRVRKAAIGAWPFWAYDNSAFTDWKEGRQFDDAAFREDILDMLDMQEDARPDFVALPDVVSGGLASLAQSMSWLHRLGRLALRFALVVQDGMKPADIPWDAPFAVIFVGGSLPWKLATMRQWADASHEHGRECHVGRVGSAKRFRRAASAEVDSIDSSLFLWSEEKTDSILRVRREPVQSAWGFA